MTKQLIGIDESEMASGCPVHQGGLVDLLELLLPPIRQHPWGNTQEMPGTVKEGQAENRQAQSAAPEHKGATRSFAVASSDRSRHGHLCGGELDETRSRVDECEWTRIRAAHSVLRSSRRTLLDRGRQLLETGAHASTGGFATWDGSRKRRCAGGCFASVQTRRRFASGEVAFSWRLAKALIC
jgi:hypothetical protein